MRHRVVIVGGGQAGFQVAASLAQRRFAGEIVLIAAENHPPYERPPLSKAVLKGETDTERLAFRPPAFFEERGIDLRLGTLVTEIDPTGARLRTAAGETVAYDSLVLATGARVRKLPVKGHELSGIFTLRTIEDAAAIRGALGPGVRLCVVGGGYIGLEVAAAARAVGAEATVLEAQERVMTRTASEPVARTLAALHARHGANLRTGVTVERFHEVEGRSGGVILADGERVPADIVVVGVGVVPETRLAEAVGIECAGGIRVDAVGKTSLEGIYAVGDCAAYAHPLAPGPMVFESVQNAVDQANAVASDLLGAPKPYAAVPWFWSDQYDARLQTAGIVTAGDRAVLRGEPEAGAFSVAHLREGRLIALETLGRIKDFVQARKLIADGAAPDPDRLADPDVPLKSLA